MTPRSNFCHYDIQSTSSVKEDKVLLTSLDDTLDTMIGFNSESLVHSSTLTSSTGVEGLDNITTSAIKPKVSFLYILLIFNTLVIENYLSF